MYRRLVLAVAAASLVEACASSHSHPPGSSAPSTSALAGTATLTGVFVTAGGPAGASAVPLSGSITIAGPVSEIVTVGPDGKYTATLPPGTYTVTGTTPQYNDGAAKCETDTGAPVTLTAGQSATADVTCQEK
jgi:hypothetical protein